jgi:nucleotide-binding universal stress UspA family protein
VVREAGPIIEWAKGRRTLNVFVACDFTASADTAISWLRELRRVGPCQVVLGYVDWPMEERWRLGVRSQTPFNENPPEVEHMLERDLRSKLNRMLGDSSARVRVLPSWGSPDFNLLQMAQEEQADLIVVGSHQRRGLRRLAHPSVSRAILHHAPMNVACVPASPGGSVSSDPIPEHHRVLVTTDFSEVANHAIPFAYSMLAHGGTVRLVHVVRPSEFPSRLTRRNERKRAKGSWPLNFMRSCVRWSRRKRPRTAFPARSPCSRDATRPQPCATTRNSSAPTSSASAHTGTRGWRRRYWDRWRKKLSLPAAGRCWWCARREREGDGERHRARRHFHSTKSRT